MWPLERIGTKCQSPRQRRVECGTARIMLGTRGLMPAATAAGAVDVTVAQRIIQRTKKGWVRHGPSIYDHMISAAAEVKRAAEVGSCEHGACLLFRCSGVHNMRVATRTASVESVRRNVRAPSVICGRDFLTRVQGCKEYDGKVIRAVYLDADDHAVASTELRWWWRLGRRRGRCGRRRRRGRHPRRRGRPAQLPPRVWILDVRYPRDRASRHLHALRTARAAEAKTVDRQVVVDAVVCLDAEGAHDDGRQRHAADDARLIVAGPVVASCCCRARLRQADLCVKGSAFEAAAERERLWESPESRALGTSVGPGATSATAITESGKRRGSEEATTLPLADSSEGG
eukprot:4614326-Prymnesium_polylepis.1